MTTVSVQAYFRNQMPAGRYPYPFWHSDAKWKAYETSNELRFRMDARGKVLFAYRADTWPEDTRPAGYEPARPPTFLGAWVWRYDSGGTQPARSEEHNSELPSLMLNSYADIWLQKQN